jgi:hypothetical protein
MKHFLRLLLLAALAMPEILQATTIDLDQNWSEADHKQWYESTQGSRLLPLSWLLALEQTNSSALFLSDDVVLRFGYVPYDLSDSLRLPRGFALDASDDSQLTRTRLRWKQEQTSTEYWVGMTCAACHTGTLTYHGTSMSVDGGPTNADFQSFMEALDAALVQTAGDTQKFGRFAARVLAGSNSPENQKLLAAALSQLNDFEARSAKLNHSDLRYGFGRLDAVGHILNKVALISGAASPTANPADAPVSYPFLWNVPQHNVLEWNGMAESHRLPAAIGSGLDIGALGRNAGEMIGVFGDVVVVKDPKLLAGYLSSINVANLTGLEAKLKKLRPPRWPSDVFGSPDSSAVKLGATLFVQKRCAECHQVLDRTDLDTQFDARMVKLVADKGEAAIGTDPWMACNAFTASGPSGLMQGTQKVDGTGPLAADDKLANMLAVEVKEVLLGHKVEVAEVAATGFFGIAPTPTPVRPPRTLLNGLVNLVASINFTSAKDQRRKLCLSTNNKLLAYKGRPLNGIWATAPYLHNGSVPTLYDLLLPPTQRPTSFYTGSTEFDPNKVGLVVTPGGANSFAFDTTKPGNSNLGHDYAVGALSDTERRALVEYMKTL